jgi:hypothetical protein
VLDFSESWPRLLIWGGAREPVVKWPYLNFCRFRAFRSLHARLCLRSRPQRFQITLRKAHSICPGKHFNILPRRRHTHSPASAAWEGLLFTSLPNPSWRRHKSHSVHNTFRRMAVPPTPSFFYCYFLLRYSAYA